MITEETTLELKLKQNTDLNTPDLIRLLEEYLKKLKGLKGKGFHAHDAYIDIRIPLKEETSAAKLKPSQQNYSSGGKD